MKVIKPLKIGALHKAYTFKFKHYFVSAPVVFFDMGIFNRDKLTTEKEVHNPYGILVENLQWPIVQEQLGTQILDMVMPKPTAEIMLAGSAWNPEFEEDPDGNREALNSKDADVAIEMEKVRKRLTIKGNRTWNKGVFGYKLSKAEPWESVIINNENAYGGLGCQDNPLGTGFVASEKQITAPKIEDIDVPVKTPGKKYAPAGFGTIDVNHSQRTQFNGNYKSKEWLEKHFPDMAPDTDFRLFQAARQDQQCTSYLKGNESYKLTNLVQGQPFFEGQLPGVNARSFVQVPDADGKLEFKEIPLNLDTVWLFPDINVGALIWHGEIEVQKLDAMDVQCTMLAYEGITDEPRSLEHYQTELLRRLDPEKAIEALLDDAPLSPVKSAARLKAEQQEIDEEIAQQEALQEAQHQQFIEDVKAQNDGRLPDGFEPPEPAKPEVLVSQKAIERNDFNAAALIAAATKQQEEAEAKRKALEEQFAEGQKMAEQQMQKPDAKALKDINAAGNVSDNIEELQDLSNNKSLDLDEEQRKMLEAQKFKAHQYSMTPISDWPKDEYAQQKRQLFINAYHAGESMAARNWSGADLSGINMTGMDLSGANLENCNLENAILDQANLHSAALPGCKLSGASFKAAQMTEANLSSAVAQFATFDGACMYQAQLMKVNFENSTFTNCNLRMALVFGSRLHRCQFSGADLTKLSMVECFAMDSDFTRVKAEMLVAMQCNFALSRFDKVELQRSAFLETLFNVCSFAEARLEKCQFSGGSELSGANMVRIEALQCGFRRANAKYWYAHQASFKECDLGDSDFHHGNFSETNLTQSVLSESRFVQCNLRKATLYTALLRTTLFDNCDLSDANFYQADALMAMVSGSNFTAAENVETLTMKRWKRAS